MESVRSEMDDASRLSLIVVILLILCAAYFAVAETSFASVSKVRIKVRAERGEAKAIRALKVLDNFDLAITSILICTNIVHLSAASIATLAVTRMFPGVSGAVTISTFVMTLVVFFAGEMLPKSIAKKYSERLSLAVAGSLWFFMTVLKPLATLLTAIGNFAAKLAKADPQISVTEDGIQFNSGENDSGQTGTVTTGGGNLNVRTGAGMDYTAFTQLPNGTTVKVIGTDGDWLKVILPEKVGYVYSGYMTVSGGEAGSGEGSFSLDAETLENLLGMLGGSLNGGAALTPDGNLSLIDDIGSPTASGKQFITVETKNGNVFYLIIDRDDEGEETVHFLNQVDEADLMALTEDGEKTETPIVCTCTEKCQAGAVNTACPVCVKNLSECVGTEQKAAEPTEPENPEPEKKSNAGAILAVLLILAAGGGAAVHFLVLKPKQGKKVPADLDDFDLEDEEEYLTEDKETEENNE